MTSSPSPTDPTNPIATCGPSSRFAAGLGRRFARVVVTTGLAGVVLAGCAERQVVAAPDAPPSAIEWTVVGIAGALVALLLGVLVTLPAWRTARGDRFAVAVLAAHAGGVVAGGTVLAGVAVRSWQLLDRPFDATPAAALLRISRVDGDTGFYSLMVLSVVIITALVATLLAVAARYAATEDPPARYTASSVLAALAVAGTAALVMIALGSRAWPYLLLGCGAPISAAAAVTCWPERRRPA